MRSWCGIALTGLEVKQPLKVIQVQGCFLGFELQKLLPFNVIYLKNEKKKWGEKAISTTHTTDTALPYS